MLGAMHPFGVYALDIYNLVYKELQTYAETLDGVTADIDETLRENFVITANNSGLEAYERLIGAPRTELETELRRSMVKALLNVGENDFTIDGIMRYFESIDFHCEIEEDPMFFNLLIIPAEREYTHTEQEFIRERAKEFLPCHLSFTIEFRNADWDTYDFCENTFDRWDSFDYTWDELDKYEGG